MNEMEKLTARIEAVDAATAATMHAASVDRKLSDSKHFSGHFTKALTELNSLKNSLEELKRRADARAAAKDLGLG